MKTDRSKPRREFPFVVIAEYGMGVRNSGVFSEPISPEDVSRQYGLNEIIQFYELNEPSSSGKNLTPPQTF